MDLFCEDLWVQEDFQPIFGDLFPLGVEVLRGEFFSGEDVSCTFEVLVFVVVLAVDDLVHVGDEGVESGSELLFQLLDFFLHLFVDWTFLFEVVVEGDAVDFLFQSGKGFDFVDDFFFDVEFVFISFVVLVAAVFAFFELFVLLTHLSKQQ